MRILGDNTITNATITASTVYSYANGDQLKTFDLSKRMKGISGSVDIELDFGSDTSDVNCVVLCGSNISDSATVELSYSNTDIDTPDDTISLPKFSNFNQVFFLDTALDRRFWKIHIVDPDPQDSTGVEMGYLYIGEYTQLDYIVYPHEPTLNLSSTLTTSPTRQITGSKTIAYTSLSFTADNLTQAETYSLLDMIEGKMNIDPVVVIQDETDYDALLYPPRYGILTATSYSYAAQGQPNNISLGLTFEEVF
jgi:hypothetical protein